VLAHSTPPCREICIEIHKAFEQQQSQEASREKNSCRKKTTPTKKAVVVKKAVTKKPSVKKPVAKKIVAKKVVAKKVIAKKPVTKKAVPAKTAIASKKPVVVPAKNPWQPKKRYLQRKNQWPPSHCPSKKPSPRKPLPKP
jgi:hypothetical protein